MKAFICKVPRISKPTEDCYITPQVVGNSDEISVSITKVGIDSNSLIIRVYPLVSDAKIKQLILEVGCLSP